MTCPCPLRACSTDKRLHRHAQAFAKRFFLDSRETIGNLACLKKGVPTPEKSMGEENAAGIQLKSMARSLQEHIALANELNLNFTAQLLAMALMEITTTIHGISQQELDALCERLEEKAGCDARQAMAVPPDFRSHTRRSRVRRSRSQW
jgi:hypothetical protein